MFDLENGIMRITKGDSAEIVVDFEDYTMQSGDKLVFTAKNKIGGDVWCTVESTNNIIKLTPTNTKNFVPGKGCYDIELRTGTDVYTFVGLTDTTKSNMIVYAEVTE